MLERVKIPGGASRASSRGQSSGGDRPGATMQPKIMLFDEPTRPRPEMIAEVWTLRSSPGRA